MDDIDAAEDWLESWASQVDEQAQRNVELARRVAGLTGSGSGLDSAVRVTVRSSGQLERLELDDRVRGLTGADLAREITATIRRAEADVAARVAEQVRQTVGADSETGRAVMHSFESRFPPRDERDGTHDGA
ncbi:hypothetical protein Asp14428_76070 [Actinoplanes sp. NBRC 14428]|nr:hypothetical protein Asp14428_76070 [Actinoplanes sp. NBRC 14428]